MQFNTYPMLGLEKKCGWPWSGEKHPRKRLFSWYALNIGEGQTGGVKAFSCREAGVNCHADKIDL